MSMQKWSNGVKIFIFIRYQKHLVIGRKTSYMCLSHIMLWNWFMNFIYLFSGTLYIVWLFKKCVVTVLYNIGNIENHTYKSKYITFVSKLVPFATFSLPVPVVGANSNLALEEGSGLPLCYAAGHNTWTFSRTVSKDGP
jgi:hypothetical protein